MSERSEPCYKPGFFNRDKPYRDFLLESMHWFGQTSFRRGEEMWSLGGIEHVEFWWLVEQGVKFTKGSYHNVDECERELFRVRPGGVQGHPSHVTIHPSTNFYDICDLWKKPAVIAFDSTIGIAESNANKWWLLVNLVERALERSPKVLLVSNYATGFSKVKRWGGDFPEVMGKWLGRLFHQVGEENCSVFDYAAHDVMAQSRTPMLATAIEVRAS